MNRSWMIGAVALAIVASDLVGPAQALECNLVPNGCVDQVWHGDYYNMTWGAPVAVVVPPTVGLHTELGWGIGGNRVLPIGAQYQRSWPGQMQGGTQGFKPTPTWPSDTEQFGFYYIRGPW